jgi:hypothetical protein
VRNSNDIVVVDEDCRNHTYGLKKGLMNHDSASYFNSKINEFIEMPTYFDAETHLWHPLL